MRSAPSFQLTTRPSGPHEDRVVPDALDEEPEDLLAVTQLLLIVFQLCNGGFQLRGALLDPVLEILVELPDRFFGPLALGNVTDYGKHEAGFAIVCVVHRADGAQGQLDPDLLAFLRHRGKVQRRVRVDVAALARPGIAGYPRPVGILERLGNQLFDAHRQGLGGRVTEHLAAAAFQRTMR